MMMTMSKLHFLSGLAALALVLAAPVAASAKDCEALPRSALKTRECNPQSECQVAIPKEVKGAALEARRKECGRLPKSGVCHGPDRYDPQAECRSPRRK